MGRTVKILICDDSLIIRRKLSESIKIFYSDVVIVEAPDSYDAERLYLLHRPDLVFMDIILPDRNGIDTVKRIKEIDPQAKLVMVSSAGTKANLFKAFGAGAYDFIQKPIEQPTVEKVLKAFFAGMNFGEDSDTDETEETVESEQNVSREKSKLEEEVDDLF